MEQFDSTLTFASAEAKNWLSFQIFNCSHLSCLHSANKEGRHMQKRSLLKKYTHKSHQPLSEKYLTSNDPFEK